MDDRRNIAQVEAEKRAWRDAYIKNGLYCCAVVLVLALCLLPLIGCRMDQAQAKPTADVAQPLIPEVVPDGELVILATGDIMMHDTQIEAGWQPASQSYDYSSMFAQVAPLLQQGDLVIGNLEVPLAGKAAKYSGYPMFNAPEILAKNLKAAGFDVVTTANNHCLDKRYEGVVSTLDFLDQAGLLHTGTARSAEEQGKILTAKVKGLKIAFVAATYGTNGLTLPKGKEYAVNYLDQAMLLKQIAQARSQGAQYVIAMLHWGQEYQNQPNQAQKDLSQALLAGGADLILGHHPHVLQRGELVAGQKTGEDSPNGDPKNDKFVMYSLGNFISSQKGLERLSSLILKVTLGLDGTTGQAYFREAEYIPIYTQKKDLRGKYHFTVWPIERALAAAKKTNSPFNEGDRQALTQAWEHVIGSQPAMALLQLEQNPI